MERDQEKTKMATIEKLMVQIFERKKRIVEQVKQQTFLFDQHLASKCILDGIAPPPWLWSPSLPSTSSAPEELNKEQLISGLLLPYTQPSNLYSNGYCSFYNQPAIADNKGDLHDSFIKEACISSEGFPAGDRLLISPQLPVNITRDVSNGTQKPNSEAAASVHNKREARMADAGDQLTLLQQPCITYVEDASDSLQKGDSRDATSPRNQIEAGVTNTRDGLSISLWRPVIDTHGASNSVQKPDLATTTSLQVQTDGRNSVEGLRLSFSAQPLVSDVGGASNGIPKPDSSVASSLQRDARLSDAGDQFSVSLISNSDVGGASNGHQKPDHSTATPLSSQRDLRMSGTVDRSSISPHLSVDDIRGASNGFQKSGSGVAASSQHQRYARPSDAEDLLSVPEEPTSNVGCTSSGVQKPDYAVTSPRDQRDVRMSEVSPEPPQSLGIIQRSKSRQRALDIRNSAKSFKTCLNDENDAVVLATGITGSEPAFPRYDHVHESELVEFFGKKNEICVPEETKTGDLDSQENELFKDYVTMEPLLPDQLATSYSSGDGAPSNKLADIFYREEQSDGLDTDIDPAGKGSAPGDAPSDLHQLSVNDTGLHLHGVFELDSGSTPLHHERERVLDIDPEPFQSLVKIQRSKSRQRALELRDSAKAAKGSFCFNNDLCVYSSVLFESGMCSSQTGLIQEPELVKPVDINNEISVVEEAKVHDSQIKEKGCSIDAVRTKMKSSHLMVPDYQRASEDEDNVVCSNSCDWLTESMLPSPCQLKERKVGGQLSDPVSASPSLRENNVAKPDVHQSPVDDVELHVSGESKTSFSSPEPVHICELELMKPVEIHNDSSAVLKGKAYDSQSKEKSGHIYSCRITRSRTSGKHAVSKGESLSVVKSPSPWKSRGDTGNFGTSNLRKVTEKKAMRSDKVYNSEDGSSPQHKRRKFNGQLNESTSASRCSLEKGIAESDDSENSVPKQSQNSGSGKIERASFSPSAQTRKDMQNSKERDSRKSSHCTFLPEESEIPVISSLANQASGDCQGRADMELVVADPSSTILDLRKQQTEVENEVLLHFNDKFEPGSTEYFTFSDCGKQERTRFEENDELPYCSVRQSVDLHSAGETMPDFEGFIVNTDDEQTCISKQGISLDKLDLPKTTIQRASVLEQICKSACMHKPSEFSPTHKFYGAPSLDLSVPNRLLECMDLRSNLCINDELDKNANISCSDEEVNNAFPGSSPSGIFPFSSAQSVWDIRKPCASPIGKLLDWTISNSGSSEKRPSLQLELPCINEENENVDEAIDAFKDSIGSVMMTSSNERKPLADITENANLLESVAEADVLIARSSLESLNTEYSFSGTCNKVNKKFGQHNSTKKRHTRTANVSCNRSMRGNSTNRISESVTGKFGKPKLSGKESLRNGGPSLLDKESKHNNIVSNITSFVPLVQQKKAAAVITGKRDVKVKALEAAEAAKRHAEEKEKERKMKKEALKLERARLEQENLKQMELQKKKKEEERKKKEADMAARKRQREEEEKKEKERKRIRIAEGRKQLKENEEKLRTRKEKGVQSQATDERVNEINLSKDKIEKQNEKGREMKDEGLQKMLKSEPKATVVLNSDAGKGNNVLVVPEDSIHCGESLKVSNLAKATYMDNFQSGTSQEQSYDISPYKGSDDEDEDEEEIPNSKFVPSWASKKCVALVIPLQQKLNPEVIFPPESFCSIAEVLLPRKLQPK